jgi:hypothetical protein
MAAKGSSAKPQAAFVFQRVPNEREQKSHPVPIAGTLPKVTGAKKGNASRASNANTRAWALRGLKVVVYGPPLRRTAANRVSLLVLCARAAEDGRIRLDV